MLQAANDRLFQGSFLWWWNCTVHIKLFCISGRQHLEMSEFFFLLVMKKIYESYLCGWNNYLVQFPFYFLHCCVFFCVYLFHRCLLIPCLDVQSVSRSTSVIMCVISTGPTVVSSELLNRDNYWVISHVMIDLRSSLSEGWENIMVSKLWHSFSEIECGTKKNNNVYLIVLFSLLFSMLNFCCMHFPCPCSKLELVSSGICWHQDWLQAFYLWDLCWC